jgi:hypothetical protein
MPTSERHELAAFLASFAHRNDFYFRDSSNYMKRTTDGFKTVSIVVFRPVADGEEWPEVTAHAIRDGQPYVTFQNPPDQRYSAAADKTRAGLLTELRQEWPATQEIPILPSGGLPDVENLRQTPAGLRIDRAKAIIYDLPANSPLLAQ